MESGYSKPTALIKMPDRDGLVGVLTKNYTILRSKAEFDQLRTGLAVLGVGEALQKYPHLTEPLFVFSQTKPLTAGIVYSAFF